MITELPSPARASFTKRDWELVNPNLHGIIVTRESPSRLTLAEPVSWTAPSIARPYCCYIRTVIFYHHPHWHHTDGQRLLEWERREPLLSWDMEIEYEGQKYVVGGGRVVRHRKGWFMRRSARIK